MGVQIIPAEEWWALISRCLRDLYIPVYHPFFPRRVSDLLVMHASRQVGVSPAAGWVGFHAEGRHAVPNHGILRSLPLLIYTGPPLCLISVARPLQAQD